MLGKEGTQRAKEKRKGDRAEKREGKGEGEHCRKGGPGGGGEGYEAWINVKIKTVVLEEAKIQRARVCVHQLMAAACEGMSGLGFTRHIGTRMRKRRRRRRGRRGIRRSGI